MRLCLLPGDGIGPEVIGQARRVLEALAEDGELELELAEGEIGFGTYQVRGTALPEETLALVKSADATLFGAVTTPAGIPEYRSPILRLRQELDLYANVRPIHSLPGTDARVRCGPIDMVIVRENTEGLYAGIEREEGDRAVTERVITRKASERIVRFACELATDRGSRRVCVVHKANVLRATDGLFLRVAREVGAQFPDLAFTDMLVDACAMNLIREPESFEVIVTTNMFGDILSDEASMLMGGLGLAYSANVGAITALFEPVHGSAPDLVGTGSANPLATLLSLAFLLRHAGEPEAGDLVGGSVRAVLRKGRVTPDLGGSLRTREVTDAVLEEMSCWRR